MMRFLALAAIVSLLALWITARASSSASQESAFVYTVAAQYDPLSWLHGADRFPSGAQLSVHDARGERLLVTDFVATADADLSFDGKRVVFAGRRTSQDAWEIWETSLEGGIPRKVVACAAPCARPLYLPEDRVVYARSKNGRFTIEAAFLHKPGILQLTYGLGNSLPLNVLRDGRVLFESEYPLGRGASSELYTVYSDGSGVESYRCDHHGNRHSGRQVSSGDIVLVSGDRLTRFTSPLAEELQITPPKGEYAGNIAEMPAGQWLLAWRPDSSQRFQLRLWEPGAAKLEPVLRRSNANILDPVLLAPRPVPNRHPSALHDWNYGHLLCLNAYTGKNNFAADSLRAVKVYTQDEQGHSQLLGEAPVEKDGSFYVRVPGDRPLRFELLNGSGATVKKEDGWFWLRGGEQRVCVGCHAGPETAPENAVPAVLLRSTVAADMTATPGQASGGH